MKKNTLPIKAIASGNTAAVIINGQAHTVTDSHPAFKRIKDAIQHKRFSVLPKLMDIKVAVESFSKNLVEIKGNQVLVDGKEVHGSIVDRIVNLLKSGDNATPLIEFFKKVLKNPTEFVRTDLFNFLQHQNLPLTTDGCFLAYKGVNNNYTDVHTGKFDNSIGKTVSMPRESCDLSRAECSTGLHVAALPYIQKNFNSSRIIVVKVNPEDVVAVPPDYNGMKLRTCKYVVLKDFKEPIKQNVVTVKMAKDKITLTSSSNRAKATKMSTARAIEFLNRNGVKTSKLGNNNRKNIINAVEAILDTKDDS